MYFIRRRYLPIVISIDKIGGAYAKVKRVFVKPKKLEKDKINEILVLSLDLIGDGILASLAFRTLRENFPKAEITVVAGPWNKQIFENNPDINRVEIINPFWTRSVKMSFLKRVIAYFKIYLGAKKKNYDLGIDLRGEFLSILLMKKMGAEYAAGYGITGGGWMLDKCADFEGDRFAKHIVERNLDLLRAIGLKISENLDLAVYPNKENQQVVDKFFKDNGLQAGDKIAVIHPGSNDQARCWDNDRWAEVISYLIDDFGYKAILSGGPGDISMINDISSKFKVQSSKFKSIQTPKTLNENLMLNTKYLIHFLGYSILDLAELIKRADLLLCVNSAALHIGAAVKTPSVVLFAGSYPKTYGPWLSSRGQSTQNLKSMVLFKDAECFPCGKSFCKNNVCMRDISVEEVAGAVKNLEQRYKDTKKQRN